MAEQQMMRPRASTPDERAREDAVAMAQAEQDARERRADESIPGGRYMVNGQIVNAIGGPANGVALPEER